MSLWNNFKNKFIWSASPQVSHDIMTTFFFPFLLYFIPRLPRCLLRWTDEARFAGFSVYVSTGALSDNQFFVHPFVFYDRGPGLPNSDVLIDLQEPVLGDYVTIYNNRTNRPLPNLYTNSAILELCEVTVLGRALSTFIIISVLSSLAMCPIRISIRHLAKVSDV